MPELVLSGWELRIIFKRAIGASSHRHDLALQAFYIH